MRSAELTRGALLRDVPARTPDGRTVQVSDFRGRRNIALIFSGEGSEALVNDLGGSSAALNSEEAVVLLAGDSARAIYDAPSAAIFITDRYAEVFFVARVPRDPLPSSREVLKWLEFINSQCPE